MNFETVRVRAWNWRKVKCGKFKSFFLTSFNVRLSFLKMGPNKSGVQAGTMFSSLPRKLYAILFNRFEKNFKCIKRYKDLLYYFRICTLYIYILKIYVLVRRNISLVVNVTVLQKNWSSDNRNSEVIIIYI